MSSLSHLENRIIGELAGGSTRETPHITDALTDRIAAWLGIAMTRAKVSLLTDTDLYVAVLPPFRKFSGTAITESVALSHLRTTLENWASGELIAGRELPTWESQIPEVSPAAWAMVRVSSLKRQLHTRAALWGAVRQNLPAGAVERCLNEMDAVVTRHAMQGVSPPPENPSRSQQP